MHRPLYFDYAATTPIDASVLTAMQPYLSQEGCFGNAASGDHLYGREAQSAIESARQTVAACIGAKSDTIFWTSGATESNNLAILGIARANRNRGKHLITSAIEHKSVLEPCEQLKKEGFEITVVQPTDQGLITAESVQQALRSDTVLVSIMMVNNEIGTIQPIEAIGNLLRDHSANFHVDAVQGAGKLPIQVEKMGIDALTLSAHKMYGPKGSGLLYLRRNPRLLCAPLCFGGDQEYKMRPGTLATHQIIGLSAALQLTEQWREQEFIRLSMLKQQLWSGFKSIDGVSLNGDYNQASPHILNTSFEGVDGEALLTVLNLYFALSSGSACTTNSIELSHVLRALRKNPILAHSAIRFSLGRYTESQHVEQLVIGVKQAVERLRSISPLWRSPGRPLGFKLEGSV